MNRILLLGVATIIVSLGSVPSLTPILEELWGVRVRIEDAIEFIRTRDRMKIAENIKWQEITAAGMKLSEVSWDGFVQHCERIVFDFGNLQVYLDAEVRMMWVLSDDSEADAYYVKLL